MSGFVGIVNLNGAPIDASLLGRMTKYLAFRGPDKQGVRVARNVGFGHALLRITDESNHEEQPFTLDSRAWIAADARVDSRQDLIAELKARQEELSESATDVELILRAYRVWGEDCVRHFLGDFSFAVWDEDRQRLFCARDHLGVKPFFYSQVGHTLVLSNTLDCVRLHPAVSRDLNDSAIADFLLFGANQEFDTTSFRDIRRLPPAHCITWSKQAPPRCRRYWTLPVEESIYFKRAEDYSDRFKELLQVALRDRLRTRRVGVLMSGGLDSPTLAAVAKSVLREGPADFSLTAITSVYDRLIPDIERHYASLVADHLNIPIRYDVRDDETSIADWDRVSVHTPEPVDNPPAFAAGINFAKHAAGHAHVFLYGEGPDNALLYEWRPYLSHLLAKRRVAGLVRALSNDLLMHRRVPLWSSIQEIARATWQKEQWLEEFPGWLNEEFAARCRCRERWEALQRPAPSPHPVRPRGYNGFNDVRWQSLFEGCDITGALSHSEMRHPFLDLRVLQFMLALPPMPWCRNKMIIRRSMRTALPRDVVWRRKSPLQASPDFKRVQAFGFPRLEPSPNLLKYVNPAKIPSAPQSLLAMRVALRPLGLNYWLHDLARN